MKVLSLQCAHLHLFEGWFASEKDFQSQLACGLLSCPVCSSKNVQKMPSAPRLNLGHGNTPAASTAMASAAESEVIATPALAADASGQTSFNQAQQAAFLQALRHLVVNTEDVGERFVNEARRMHYGEAQMRNIRGQASPQETLALLEEGIEVMPLPASLKETLQ